MLRYKACIRFDVKEFVRLGIDIVREVVRNL
jgi:hypothetical protein